MFKQGDVVQFKSGGPKMTVASYTEPSRWGYPFGIVRCEWFTRKGERESDLFLPSSLVSAENETLEFKSLKIA